MKTLLSIIFSVLLSASLFANDVKIDGLSFDAASRTLTFTVDWKNAWNYKNGDFSDAIWLFVKFHPQNGNGEWIHSDIETGSASGDGNSQLANDKKGLFVFLDPTVDFSGNTSAIPVSVVLHPKIDSYLNPDIQVFAIEMVRIPDGSFYVGDGRPLARDNYFTDAASYTGILDAVSPPYFMSSEGSISTIDNTGIRTVNAEGIDLPTIILASFPKGTSAFYIMKYEVSQSQFIAMANTLPLRWRDLFPLGFISGDATPTARNGVRSEIDASSGLKVFSCDLNNNGIPNEENDGTALPFNYTTDGFPFVAMLYLDWACLRPMSVFEFEKAARGILNPVAHEMAWGNSTLNQILFSTDVINIGKEDEQLSSPDLAGKYLSGSMIRCGGLATGLTNPTRTNTSSSYYGVHDLSGNLLEITIFPGTKGAFSNSDHGDGNVINILGFGTISAFDLDKIQPMGGSYRNIGNGISTLEVSFDQELIMGIRGVRTSE